MDLKSNVSPVLTDHPPVNKSRLGMMMSYPPSGASFTSTKFTTIPRFKKPAKLDDVRSNGWLDAMKSSSPPRKKILKDFTVEVSADDAADIAYCSWMLKYPSALKSFEQITNYAKNKKIAVFLDYDGTLSPIVDDPDCAFMSENMRSAVRNVAEFFPTAIISGRSRDKVYELVGLKELYYAGSHGMDIMSPVSHKVSDDHLHEECSTQIIHCDIKPQNILLDDYYNARISDFGLSKLLMINQSQTKTGIRGTKGYIAPDWFRTSPITVKVDVYSFGVLLLEIICCRRNVDMEFGGGEKGILTDWAYDCFQEGKLDVLVENDAEVMNDMKQLEKFVMVAIWCLQEDPSLDPP